MTKPIIPPIIAVDGTAASGKGTLCKLLAAKLGYAYLDTGRLYRLVGYETMQQGIDASDEKAVTQMAEALKNTLKPEDLENPALSEDDAGQLASVTGVYQGVRKALFDYQKEFSLNPPLNKDLDPSKGAILDGRDIGTVIAPQADVKLFVTASLDVRAKRRTKELQSKDIPVTYDAVFDDMKARDIRDASRSAAPMIQTEDATLIDTTDMTIDETFDKAYSIIQKKLNDHT